MNIFSIFLNMRVCCVFSLKSPHQGNSNEYKQYTIFIIKKKITLDYPKSAAMGFYAKELKNEFETAVVNEPSVFVPLKFYCIWVHHQIFPSKTHSINLDLSYKTDLDLWDCLGRVKLVLQQNFIGLIK